MAQQRGSQKRQSPGIKPLGEGRRFLTTDEVAEQLGLTRRTVQRWVKEGLLPSYQFGVGKGTTYRIDPKDLEAFLQKHHKGG